VVLVVAASADDICDIVSYTPFEVADATFTGTTTMTDVVAASLDISGNIDIDGVTNLDVVDIDGAVDMATTLAVAGNVDFNGDLDVDGTTNLDVVDIDGAVNLDAVMTLTANSYFKASAGNGYRFNNAADSHNNVIISDAGLVTVRNGIDLTDGNLSLAAGHGINFSLTGDGAGTDSSELLDDYEEGTWAPVLTGLNAGSSNGTYSVQNGIYTKVGRLINANFHIDIGALNDGTGALVMTGLPYAAVGISNNYGSMTIPHVSGWSGNYYNISGLVAANASQMAIYYQASNGNMVAATHAQLQTGNFLATIVYQTAS